mmetsp:Transcript_51148/g.102200  ORF Transcript_51148/g.102200 Transcript_51148/m.102200 type:complete len:230 (+) Transcript_51148:347-1036(+)
MASFHRCLRLATSSSSIAGTKASYVHADSCMCCASSTLFHTPTARPAAMAAPRAVISIIAGRFTVVSITSDWNRTKKSLAVTPPSTFMSCTFNPASSTIASATSFAWNAIDSSIARTMWAEVVYCVRPTMTPRASSLQCGAKRPENAGTRYTPPVSGTDSAMAVLCFTSSMILRLSLSHEIPTPAIATEPSRAYLAGSSPNLYATVVSSPCLDRTHSVSVLRMRKHPEP